MKKWIIVIALLATGGAGFWLWSNLKNSRLAAAPPSRVTTATVELCDISFAVNAAGEIGPAEQVSVRPEINGLLELLPVDIGDHVKKGALLFKLDDKELQQQKASNLTDIERTRLELTKAERDFKRSSQLLADKLIAQELFDDTKTTCDLAKNSLERSQKDLAITEEHLTKTIVRAPFDCTVLTRPVSIGQAVSGSGGFNSGTEVLTIADLNSMIINAQVNQADVPRLKPGQLVEVTAEAVAGLCITGAVERIAPQATIKNNIKGFTARIILTNVDERIRPGMTASVKIPISSAANVPAVPLAAVFTEKNPDTDEVERFVYVQQGESFEKRNVHVGICDFFNAEIQEGLSPGEVVTLEMPKEEQEKFARVATKHFGGRGGSGAKRAATSPASTTGAGTNKNSAVPVTTSPADVPSKTGLPPAERSTRAEGGGATR